MKVWKSLGASPKELRLAHTLVTGQAFGWASLGDDREWVGALGDSAVALRENEVGCAEWMSVGGETDGLEDALNDYFQLEVELEPLYEHWTCADDRMAMVSPALGGTRVLRQDPVECLLSFICSSNNNISRITLMLRRLRERYGRKLCDDVYAFPTLEALAENCTEQDLRDMGFGYRAPYIVDTVKLALERGGSQYLTSLRGRPRQEVQESLLDFKGVGRKVADCVALFSLDVHDAIPVDTHVWRLARRDYDPTLKDVKSITPTVYEQVGDLFRDRFGDKAGWAHSVLFAAELPAFSSQLPESLLADMRDFKQQEKLDKAKANEAKKARKLSPPPPPPVDDDDNIETPRKPRRRLS